MPRRVLIVDDELGHADVIAEVLSELGYETAIAINGKRALETMEAWRPDLVLLDIMMPILGGVETLQRIRADESLTNLPVVMMTALIEALPKDNPPAYQAALHKPFSLQTLLDTVRELLDPA